MKSISFIFILLFCCFCAFSQQISPDSPFKFGKQAAVNQITEKIVATEKTYAISDISTIEAAVHRNNMTVETQMREVDSRIDEVYRQLKRLQTANNIREIQDNLEKLKNSRKSVIESTEKQLKELNYQGLYLGIVSQTKTFSQETEHIEKIQNAILPQAIATFNGAFIKNIIEMENNMVSYDNLKEKISGSMETANTEWEDRSFSTGYFIQVKSVKVYPLQQKLQSTNATSGGANVKIIDLLNNNNYFDELNSITDEELRKKVTRFLEEKLGGLKEEILKYNQTSQGQEAAMLGDMKEKIEEQDKKIRQNEEDFKEITEKVQLILKSIEVPYEPNNLKNCLSVAEKKLMDKLDGMKKEKNVIKEKELIEETFDVAAQGGNPAEALAKDALSRVQMMEKKYSQLKGFSREISLSNGKIDEITTQNATDVFREVQQFSLYPIPNGNQFKMCIVARFSILNQDTNPGSEWNEDYKGGQMSEEDLAKKQREIDSIMAAMAAIRAKTERLHSDSIAKGLIKVWDKKLLYGTWQVIDLKLNNPTSEELAALPEMKANLKASQLSMIFSDYGTVKTRLEGKEDMSGYYTINNDKLTLEELDDNKETGVCTIKLLTTSALWLEVDIDDRLTTLILEKR